MLTKELYKQLGLTDLEYNQITKSLGREPNELETYLFSAMWSEHCGYSHSKKYLSKFPKTNAFYEQENAGGVKIGDKALFFKVESHNHPSAVEPFQGAATGIGGIIRDILALGARPIALLDSLKFGKINTKDSEHTKHLLDGVVRGISVYGNSIGVPTVAGEVGFDSCYETSPLVNVMAVGLVDLKDIKLSAAVPDKFVVLVGSHTGRDGIHGASFASKELNNFQESRPSVQVGDPFVKKNLIEATLEILKSDEIFACQDCGAAGILSSTSEMAYKGNCGMELYLDKVHLREKNIQPWEIMLSESQERMVFISSEKGIEQIKKIAEKYELPYSVIGKTIKEKEYRLFWRENLSANVSPEILNNTLLYDLNEKEPDYIKEFSQKTCTENISLEKAVEKIVSDPNFASKNWIYSQYDYSVGNKTMLSPSKSGAAGIWLKETDEVIGLTIDSNGRQVFLNPYQGSKNTIYESYRNLVSSGFKPLGITDCLNFGNPEKNEVAYQFVKSVEGIADACRELSIPVVSGNVSFYNECEDVRVYPTPTIGMVGIAGVNETIQAKFGLEETVYLIGKQIDENSKIGSSLYQMACFDFLGGEVDEIDVELEKKLEKTIFELRNKNILKGAIDVSEGGLLGALLEGLFNSDSGFEGDIAQSRSGLLARQQEVMFFFGEITGRYLISTKDESKTEEICAKNDVPYFKLGKVTNNDEISFNGYKFSLFELKHKYMNAISEEQNL